MTEKKFWVVKSESDEFYPVIAGVYFLSKNIFELHSNFYLKLITKPHKFLQRKSQPVLLLGGSKKTFVEKKLNDSGYNLTSCYVCSNKSN